MRSGSARSGHAYHDAAGVELGYGGMLEVDVYPVSPLVIHVDGEAGVLGQAIFGDARATVGIQIERGELYCGWQVFAVDPLTSSTAVLHGPIAGVRAWMS